MPGLKIALWTAATAAATVLEGLVPGFLGQTLNVPLWALLVLTLTPVEDLTEASRRDLRRIDHAKMKKENT